MLPPYPVEIVSLIPQFLTRRNAKFDYPLRAAERLGIDRPALVFLQMVGQGPAEGVAPLQLGNAYYYSILDAWRPQATAAESAGLVSEDAAGRWHLAERGISLLRELRTAVRAYHRDLRPIPETDIATLGLLLERAFQAAAPTLPQDERSHLPRAARQRGEEPLDSPMARLDAALFGLWCVRDDAHRAAWEGEGLAGPALDVLTRIWRDEAPSAAELAPKLAQQRPADVDAAISLLRARGWVAPGEPLRPTEAGRDARQRIEDETDRLFFSPWPDDVGREGSWIQERLGAVNQALA